jgi:hypothetical protein
MVYIKSLLLENLTKKKTKPVFLILQKNIKSKKKFNQSQAWEKCSALTQEEAMQEYINLYYEISGEKPVENCVKKIIDFDDLEIPEDYESPVTYSSNAKLVQKEISDYLLTSSENEKLIHKLKDKIYSGDVVSADYFKQFEKDNQFDCKIIK